MAKLNLLESVLLGLLARRGSAGYDIHKYLEKTGRIYGYAPQASQIYRQLATLVDRGLLEFEVDRDRSGPDAKVYSPTRAGFRAFLDWVEEPFVPAERPMDAHFQRHFSLAGGVSPVIALRIVETELAFREEQEARWNPEMMMPTSVREPFDPDWMAEATYLSDSRGNQLASLHISWLRTTSRRIRHYIERSGEVWPDQRWAALAGE